MSDDLVKLSIAELQEVVHCRCRRAYKDRGLRDPSCECDSADAVKIVAARIEELEAALDSAEIANGLTDNGNLWRFWAERANRHAKENEALRAKLAKAVDS